MPACNADVMARLFTKARLDVFALCGDHAEFKGLSLGFILGAVFLQCGIILSI
jgi:hypothetical protein